MHGPLREDHKIEYLIRRRQYAIQVIKKSNYSREGMGGPTAQRNLMLEHAFEIIELKKRLYKLTGRHSPLYPKWPRTTL